MKRIAVAVFTFAAFGLVMLPRAGRAQLPPHQDHMITFDTPVALANGVTLPAGTYRFGLPSPSEASVTRVFSQDGSKLLATLQTISKRRSSTNGFDVVVVAEGTPNAPRRLQAWFCDGSATGHEFIAQKQKD